MNWRGRFSPIGETFSPLARRQARKSRRRVAENQPKELPGIYCRHTLAERKHFKVRTYVPPWTWYVCETYITQKEAIGIKTKNAVDILVLGGTRYIGIKLVEKLLQAGHNVTIGTRGIATDFFGDRVQRLFLDRHDDESLRLALQGKKFDIVYDNLCYGSEDVKRLLDATQTNRYVLTSSRGVYMDFDGTFDPFTHNLEWCNFDMDDFSGVTYYEAKRQAETAAFQVYAHIPTVSVRFPIVIGTDDDSERLQFYAEHIRHEKPMNLVNLQTKHCCINVDEAADFLLWAGIGNFVGALDACAYGTFTIIEVVSYIEKHTGKKAIISTDGARGKCNTTPELILCNKKATELGFAFSNVNDWLYILLDDVCRTV